MKISYINNKSKKYICSVCGKQFNWDENSSYYGTIDEKPIAVFCSDNCLNKYKKTKRI